MRLGHYWKKVLSVLALNEGYLRFLGLRRFAWFLVLAVGASILNSFNYVAIIPLVSKAIDSQRTGASVISNWVRRIPFLDSATIPQIGFFIILVFLSKILVNVLFSHLAGVFGEEYMFDVRARLLRRSSERYYLTGSHSSSEIQYLNNMIPKIGSFNWATFSMVSKLISAMLLFSSLLMVGVELSLVSLGFVLFWGIVLIPVLKHTRKIASEYNQSIRRAQEHLSDEIQAKEMIRIFSLSEVRQKTFDKIRIDAVRGNAWLGNLRTIVGNLQEFMVVFIGVVVLMAASSAHIEIGFLVAFAYVFSKFLGTLNESSNFLNSALEFMPGTEEVLRFVGGDPLVEVPMTSQSALENVTRIQSLRFESIRFAWQHQALFDVPVLELKRGDRILIQGKNGAGKSTLLRVLAGLLHSSGRCRVNQGGFFALNGLSAWFPRFSYLPQSSVVFRGTLVENILLNSGKTIQDIRRLEQDLDISLSDYFREWERFKISESGGNLSGGEAQIVSIFRALIRDYDVLFVDEFSNHLSRTVTDKVDRYLSRLGDKMVICISHESLEFANRRLVLVDGVLSESGVNGVIGQ